MSDTVKTSKIKGISDEIDAVGALYKSAVLLNTNYPETSAEYDRCLYDLLHAASNNGRHMPASKETEPYDPRKDPSYLMSAVRYLIEACDWLSAKGAFPVNGPDQAKLGRIALDVKNIQVTVAGAAVEVLPDKEAPPIDPADHLARLGDIYRERGKLYGKNYLHVGTLMTGLFPDGMDIPSGDKEAWNRLHLIFHLVSKLTRYSQNLLRGGHADSLDDIAVYAALARECDDYFDKRRKQ